MLIPNLILLISSVKTALKANSVPVPTVDGIATIGIDFFKPIGNPLYLIAGL